MGPTTTRTALAVERERVSESGRVPVWVRHEHLARYQFAAERAADAVVIDCACGDGTCAQLLSRVAAEVRGFDLSVEAVAAAGRRAIPSATFAVADAGALPLDDEVADVYVSLETIEHLADAEGFLREVTRVLKADATFICSTPDRDVYSPGASIESRPWNRFHVREYSQDEFSELLSRHFEHVVLFGQNPKSPTLTHARCAIGCRLPLHLLVRMTQALKLPRLLYDRLEHHQVVPSDARKRYEYVTAVCSVPRRGPRP